MFCNLQSIVCAQNNFDIAAVGLAFERAGFAGHADHIAVGGNDHIVAVGKGKHIVDIALIGNADRTARPRKQFHPRRQRRPYAAAENRNGVRAADFHDIDMAVDLSAGGIHQLVCFVYSVKHILSPFRAT